MDAGNTERALRPFTRELSPRRWLDAVWLRSRVPLSLRPDLALAAVLGLVAACCWVAYAAATGLAADDWSYIAHYHFALPGPASAGTQRPGIELSTRLMADLLGIHVRGYYLVCEALIGIMVGATYVMLRALRVDRVSAALAAALLAILPLADSLRLWWTVSPATIAVIVGCAGVAAAQPWVTRPAASRWWLVLSAALTAASVLTYEAVAPMVLIPAALALYSPAVRRTVVALVINGIVATGSAAYTFEHSVGQLRDDGTPVSGYAGRILTLAHQGEDVFVRNLMQGLPPAAGIGAVCVGVAVAIGTLLTVRLRSRGAHGEQNTPAAPSEGPPAALRGLFSAGLLLAVMFLSWVPLIPANPYYQPGALGIGNRVNASAQIFLVACAALALRSLPLLGRRTPWAPLASGTAVALGVALASSFASRSIDDAVHFVDAHRARTALLASVHSLVPSPGSGDAIVLSDYNLYVSPDWIPVFSADWDTQAAMQLTYGDPSLLGAVVGGSQNCSDTGVVFDGMSVPYERAHVIDVDHRQLVAVRDLSSCRALATALPVRPYPG